MGLQHLGCVFPMPPTPCSTKIFVYYREYGLQERRHLSRSTVSYDLSTKLLNTRMSSRLRGICCRGRNLAAID